MSSCRYGSQPVATYTRALVGHVWVQTGKKLFTYHKNANCPAIRGKPLRERLLSQVKADHPDATACRRCCDV